MTDAAARLDRDRTRAHGDAAAATVTAGNSDHRGHDVAVMVTRIRGPGWRGGRIYPIDSTLTVATPAGIVRTLEVGGSGKQTIDGLAAAPDGSVWVYVSSFVDDDFVPDPVLQIGDHSFADPGVYLFKLVP